MDSSSPERPSPLRTPFALNLLAPDILAKDATSNRALYHGLGASRTSVTNVTATIVPTAQVGNSQTAMDSSSSELSWGNLLGDLSNVSSPAKNAAPTQVAASRSAHNIVLSTVGDSADDDGALPFTRPRRQEFGGGHDLKKRNLRSQSSAPLPTTNILLPGSVAFSAAPETPANLGAPPPSATPTSVQREALTHAETLQHAADRTSSWVYGVSNIEDALGRYITPQQAPNGPYWLLTQRSEAQLLRDFEQEIKRPDALYQDSNSRFSGRSTMRSAGPWSTQLTSPQLPPHLGRSRRRIPEESIPRPLAPHSQSYAFSGHSRNLPNPTNAPALASMRQEDAPSKVMAPYDNAHPVNYPLAHLSTTQETLKPPGPDHPQKYLQYPYATIGPANPMSQPPSFSPYSSATNSAPQKASTCHAGAHHGYAASGPTSYPSQVPSHDLGCPPGSMNDTRALHPSNLPSYGQRPQPGHMLPPVQHQTHYPPINGTPSGYLQEGPGQSQSHPPRPTIPHQGAMYMRSQPSYLQQAPPTYQGAHMVDSNLLHYPFGPASQTYATGPPGSAQIGRSGQLTHHSRGQSDYTEFPYVSKYENDQNMILQAAGLGAPAKYPGNPRTSMNQDHLQKQGHSTYQTFGDDDARAALHRTGEQPGSRFVHANSQRPHSVNTEALEVRPEFTLRPDLGRSLREYARLRKLQLGGAPLSLSPELPELGNFSFPQVPAVASAPSPSSSSSSTLRSDDYDDPDGGVLTERRIVPPELPPSVEEAYRKKCIQLKTRLNEVEEANDASRLRIERLNRAIEKGRLERAFLLEQLAKRTSTNVEDSEGSPSPPPTPKEKPLRTKRGHRKPDFLSTDIGDGRAGSTFIQQGPVTLSPSSDAFSHTHPEMRNSTPQAHQAPKRHLPSNGTHASPYAVPGASRARPRSGFDIYCEENRELIIAEQGEDQIESALARGWSTMEADRKAEYSAKFEDLRRAYEAERAARHNPVDDDVEMGEDAATPGPATAAAPATGGFNPINSSRVE